MLKKKTRKRIDNVWKIVSNYQGHIVNKLLQICSQNYRRNIRSCTSNERYESYLFSVAETMLKSLNVRNQATDKNI